MDNNVDIAPYKRAIDAFCRVVCVDTVGIKKRGGDNAVPPYLGFMSSEECAEAWNALNDLPERKEFFEKLRASKNLKQDVGDLFNP